ALILHQQHADLQPLLLAMGQAARRLPGFVRKRYKPKHLGYAVALLARQPCEEDREGPARGFQRQFQILEDRQPLEDRGLLELAADAEIGDGDLIELREIDPALEEDV